MFFGSLRCFLEKTACKVQSKKSQTFVILSDSEKSTNSIFSSPFFVFCVDTSANASVWQGWFVILSLCKKGDQAACKVQAAAKKSTL